MKFIHIADVHFGAMPDKGCAWSQESRQAIKDSFYGIFELAAKEQIDLLLIAGDLFHSQPLMRELKELNYLCSQIPDTSVVLMAGNHDCITQSSYWKHMEWEKNLYFFQSEQLFRISIEEKQIDVYGLSYEKKEYEEPLYDAIVPVDNSRINILLAHGGDAQHIPIDMKKMKSSGFDYIALGHIHKPDYEPELAAYSGSLEPLDLTETGEHGYILGEITNHTTKVQFVPYSRRIYLDLKIQVKKEMGQLQLSHIIKEVIKQKEKEMYSFRMPIWKIQLVGEKDPEEEFDYEQLKLCGRIISIRDDTRPVLDLQQIYQQNKTNLIGTYIESFGEGILDDIEDIALYEGLQALLKARGN